MSDNRFHNYDPTEEYIDSEILDLYTAVNLSAKFGHTPAEIAEAVGVTVENLKEWSESTVWKHACSYWGVTAEAADPFKSDNTPNTDDATFIGSNRLHSYDPDGSFYAPDVLDVYTAVNLSVKFGHTPAEIAEAVGVTVENLKEWSKSPSWIQGCFYWGVMRDEKEWRKALALIQGCDESHFIESEKSKIYNAAYFYVKGGGEGVRTPESIARQVGVDVLTLKDWCQSPVWKEACEHYGFFGEAAFPLHKRIHSPVLNPSMPSLRRSSEDRTPYPLTEKYLLEEAFQKEGKVRIVTYAKKYKDVNIASVDRYKINLAEGNPLKKINVLLVFPTEKMSEVRKGIKRRPSLADENLSPIVRKRDRPKISINARSGDFVECILRNGLVVTGKILWISKYTIVMRAGAKRARLGKVVLIYIHGVYDFKVVQKKTNAPIKHDDFWDEEIQ